MTKSPGYPRSFVNSRPDPTTDPPTSRPAMTPNLTPETLKKHGEDMPIIGECGDDFDDCVEYGQKVVDHAAAWTSQLEAERGISGDLAIEVARMRRARIADRKRMDALMAAVRLLGYEAQWLTDGRLRLEPLSEVQLRAALAAGEETT